MSASSTNPPGLLRPIVPKEYGVWAMIYTPLVAVLIGAPPASAGPALLLVIAVTAAFFSQGAFARLGGDRRTTLWLAVYVLVLGLSGASLVLVYRFVDLLWIGLLAFLSWMVQTRRSRSAGKRIDRSVSGEILGVAGLASTGPAAYVISSGRLDPTAVGIWVAFTLHFVSGVFFVKMLVSSGRGSGTMDWISRWQLGRAHLIYHLLLVVLLAVVLTRVGGYPALLFAVAWTPVCVRAVVGWARLSGTVPPLRRIGRRELFYGLWFTGFFAAGMFALV